MSNIWLTADTHFDHANIIRFCDRPFKSVQEMNEIMILNWNQTVMPDDEIHFLGDFCFNYQKSLDFTSRLNGIKHLTMGNHDPCHPRHKKKAKSTQAYLDAGWASVELHREFQTEIGKVMVSHLPYEEGNPQFDQRFQEFRLKNEGLPLICGHVHEKWTVRDSMVNCGVDVWGFKPVTLQTIISLFSKK
jgi:calcineurin-like phosphoesterase family protein